MLCISNSTINPTNLIFPNSISSITKNIESIILSAINSIIKSTNFALLSMVGGIGKRIYLCIVSIERSIF
ncbi:hypothetical protein Krac_4905 [Ktedonobacter racemifer DSM 44963]|uniref:Uncharacterized protein n=1 Tax=Ktedonobacter racemifer DSM 44963 TaxID=485913 RepID=D6TU01_KTERA|nr:hypothetical protein Krac_4905 [Ktedonobacter racemifer DSM 44963]